MVPCSKSPYVKRRQANTRDSEKMSVENTQEKLTLNQVVRQYINRAFKSGSDETSL